MGSFLLTSHTRAQNTMKIFNVLLFAGSALSATVPYAAPYEAPEPFAYEYGGVDELGRHFAKTEHQDEYGVVQGEYSVELPDGRTQIVTYHADPENGYVADVKSEGEAKPYVHEPKPYKPPHRPVHLPPAPYHEPAPPAYPYAN